MIVHTTARKDGGGVWEGFDFLAWMGGVLLKFGGKEMNEENGREGKKEGRMDGWMIRYEDRECPSFPCVCTIFGFFLCKHEVPYDPYPRIRDICLLFS
jgi:hypothetical protein